MRSLRIGVASLVVLAAAASGQAQPPMPPLTALESALACAAPPETEVAGKDALRIIGAQTPDARMIYTPADILVIDGGAKSGLQPGQQYLIRRPLGTVYRARPAVTASIGALRIVAVNDSTALATVDRACDFISSGDYLVPFAAPQVPANAESTSAEGELDFNAPARIVAGTQNRSLAATGDFVVIDRGAGQGVTPGARFAVYRDVRVAAMPLAAIAEAVVMTTGPESSLVRITRTRDAVQPGDYLVPRK